MNQAHGHAAEADRKRKGSSRQGAGENRADQASTKSFEKLSPTTKLSQRFLSPRRTCGAGSIFRVAIEQLDRNALRAAQKTDAHARPHRGRLAREFDALVFQIGGNRIDPAHGKTEMIEAAIRCHRRRVHAVARGDWSDEDVGAAKLEIDARLALLHATNDLRAQHRLESLSHGFGVGGAQMNMIPTIFMCLLCQGASPLYLVVCLHSGETG